VTTFRDLLHAGIKAGKTPELAYESAVKGGRTLDLAEHFRSIGVDEARHIRRQMSRSVENRVFGAGGRRLESVVVPTKVIDVRSILLTATFNVGPKVLTWGSATAEEHEQRADEQDARAEDLHEDADRHRRAAKLIRAEGVRALEEVEDLSDLLDDEAA
jgi:hypothetical protein